MKMRLVGLGVLLAVIGGCDLASTLEDQCKALASNPKNKDPALEQKCIDSVDFLPDPQTNFASRAEMPYVGTDGGKLVLNLVLTDAAGKAITGLGVDAITVTGTKPDGTSEPIAVLSADTLKDPAAGVTIPRASFAAVVDYSGSIPDGSLSTMSKGLSALYTLLAPPFESEVIHFSDDVVEVVPFTSDAAELSAAAADQSTERGKTSLFDGLFKGVRDTAARADTRYRFVLLVTDGGDNDSDATEADVISAAKEGSVPLLVIAVGFADLDLIKRLATQTGGLYTYIPSFDDLSGAYGDLSDLIANGTQIALDAGPGTYESIAVDVETKDGTKTVKVGL